MWLNSKWLKFPDLPEVFANEKLGLCVFFKIMRYLQSELDNFPYWIKNIGFDG